VVGFLLVGKLFPSRYFPLVGLLLISRSAFDFGRKFEMVSFIPWSVKGLVGFLVRSDF
jgi:hypothetical protein